MATKVVFFGNERLATGVSTTAPTLQALIDAGYEVAAVVTSHQHASSRSNRELEIQTVADRNHVPVLFVTKLTDIADELTALRADIGVLVAFGRLIPQSVMDIFPHGIINLHPSLLPLHRGPIPLESVILNGETVTGVSVMQLSAKMDAGPVWARQTTPLAGDESKQALANTLLSQGSQLLVATLGAIIQGTLKPEPQDDEAATVDQRLAKSDGQIDWTKPAVQLQREIRAYLGWPGSYTNIAGRDVIITEADVADEPGDDPGTVQTIPNLRVATGRGWLIINCLKPAGKREMTARDFTAGLPKTA